MKPMHKFIQSNSKSKEKSAETSKEKDNITVADSASSRSRSFLKSTLLSNKVFITPSPLKNTPLKIKILSVKPTDTNPNAFSNSNSSKSNSKSVNNFNNGNSNSNYAYNANIVGNTVSSSSSNNGPYIISSSNSNLNKIIEKNEDTELSISTSLSLLSKKVQELIDSLLNFQNAIVTKDPSKDTLKKQFIDRKAELKGLSKKVGDYYKGRKDYSSAESKLVFLNSRVCEFFKNMSKMQSAINSQDENKDELKKVFEISKKELLLLVRPAREREKEKEQRIMGGGNDGKNKESRENKENKENKDSKDYKNRNNVNKNDDDNIKVITDNKYKRSIDAKEIPETNNTHKDNRDNRDNREVKENKVTTNNITNITPIINPSKEPTKEIKRKMVISKKFFSINSTTKHNDKDTSLTQREKDKENKAKTLQISNNYFVITKQPNQQTLKISTQTVTINQQKQAKPTKLEINKLSEFHIPNAKRSTFSLIQKANQNSVSIASQKSVFKNLQIHGKNECSVEIHKLQVNQVINRNCFFQAEKLIQNSELSLFIEKNAEMTEKNKENKENTAKAHNNPNTLTPSLHIANTHFNYLTDQESTQLLLQQYIQLLDEKERTIEYLSKKNSELESKECFSEQMTKQNTELIEERSGSEQITKQYAELVEEKDLVIAHLTNINTQLLDEKEKAEETVDVLESKVNELERRSSGLEREVYEAGRERDELRGLVESLIEKCSKREEEMETLRYSNEKLTKQKKELADSLTAKLKEKDNKEKDGKEGKDAKDRKVSESGTVASGTGSMSGTPSVPIENYKKMIEELVRVEQKHETLLKKYEKLKKEYDEKNVGGETIMQKIDSSIIEEVDKNFFIDDDEELYNDLFKENSNTNCSKFSKPTGQISDSMTNTNNSNPLRFTRDTSNHKAIEEKKKKKGILGIFSKLMD